MTSQACTMTAKEYPSSSGVLIIENIVAGDRKKADVIREILENMAYSYGKDLVQSACRNTDDPGSQEKRAVN